MRIRNLVLTALVASFAFAAAAPAFAYDDWRWHERHERHEWQEREARQQAWREHEWREHHWRQQSYAPAPGYYAPPPPPYYGNPGYYR